MSVQYLDRPCAPKSAQLRGLRLLATLLATLLALPLFLSGAREAEAGAPPLNWTYRDKNYKFSLKMFRGYEPVPLKTGEKIKACEFRDPKAKGSMRGTFNTEITVVRVHLKGGGGPVVTGGAAEGPKSRQQERRDAYEAAMRPKTIWDATLGQLQLNPEMKADLAKGKKKFKEIKSKDKPAIKGKIWQFQIPGWRKERWHVSMAEFVRDDIAYGIFMTCGAKLEKHFAKAFVKMAKSFKWIDAKAKDVERLDVLEGVRISARKRVEIERSMVSNWAVIVSPKKNYIVLYNTKDGKNHKLAVTIAKRIELIREQIYEHQFPPAHPIETVCIVRVCEDKNEYLSYGGSGGSAGYWSPMEEELVFYDASQSTAADKDTLAVLYHEAFHQYIHYSVGRVAPHSWFNEGHGDYYAGAHYRKGKFTIKPFQWRVSTVKGAIVDGPRTYTDEEDENGQTRRLWGRKGYTPLEHLVRFDQRQYYNYSSVSYAQGWSLIYFLREIVPKNKKMRAKWGHILDLYFNTLKAEVNRDGSLDADRKRRGRGDKEGDGDGDEGDGEDEDKDPKRPTPQGGDDDEGEEAPDDADGEATANEPARVYYRGLSGPAALEKALQVAFEGIDWAEFEAAWIKGTKRGKRGK